MAMGQKPIRPMRFLTDVAVIELTKGKYTIIDLVDVHKVDYRNWHAHWGTNACYAVGYATSVKGKPQKQIKLHRIILGVPDELQVDHINRDTLDNRKCNIRVATSEENQQNRGKQKNNKSGFKGVSLHKESGKFKAQIRLDGKVKHIGYYISIEEAARAYDTAARENFGDFARINYPDDSSPASRSPILPDAR